ncbi:class I adenylate-forming enzyme family protein [Propionibacterium acidifaciens]|uniref:class I adenylate-forming enzyme family protein n=1 Tax=Propionibacterium acidifaciens TaxID=556499 RepID=UPI00366F929F
MIMVVQELLWDSVRNRPDRPAVSDRTERLRWSELGARVAATADELTDLGVRPGDRVVALAGPCVRTVVLMWAVLELGAVFVPLHPGLTRMQVDHVVNDCDARVVVADGPAGAPLAGGRRVIDLADLPRVGAAPRPRRATTSENGPALLIYTSGTTGNPKGVVCPHRQVRAAVESIGSCLGYRSDDVIACRLPLAFDYGLYQLLLAADCGAEVVIVSAAEDVRLLRIIVERGVTVVPLVPSLARMLIALHRHRPVGTVLRLVTNTGARMAPALMEEFLERFPRVQYASMYGMTECKRISILPTNEWRAHPESVGRAIPGDEILILDENGEPVGTGHPGEIVVRGRTVMSGYWGVPMEAQDRYRRAPDGSVELHTGDRGRLDDTGRLFFMGRNDDIVKRHGIRISLNEIESAAERVEGVDAAVALHPSGPSESLTLCFTGPADPDSLGITLEEFLDQARAPDRIIRMDSIPLTHNAKPDRRQLENLCLGTVS